MIVTFEVFDNEKTFQIVDFHAPKKHKIKSLRPKLVKKKQIEKKFGLLGENVTSSLKLERIKDRSKKMQNSEYFWKKRKKDAREARKDFNIGQNHMDFYRSYKRNGIFEYVKEHVKEPKELEIHYMKDLKKSVSKINRYKPSYAQKFSYNLEKKVKNPSLGNFDFLTQFNKSEADELQRLALGSQSMTGEEEEAGGDEEHKPEMTNGERSKRSEKAEASVKEAQEEEEKDLSKISSRHKSNVFSKNESRVEIKPKLKPMKLSASGFHSSNQTLSQFQGISLASTGEVKLNKVNVGEYDNESNEEKYQPVKFSTKQKREIKRKLSMKYSKSYGKLGFHGAYYANPKALINKDMRRNKNLAKFFFNNNNRVLKQKEKSLKHRLSKHENPYSLEKLVRQRKKWREKGKLFKSRGGLFNEETVINMFRGEDPEFDFYEFYTIQGERLDDLEGF